MLLKNELYSHIYSLQGVRHPISNYDGLNKAKTYIEDQLKKAGIQFVSKPFYVRDFDKPFYNVEATIGSNTDLPLLIFGSHYDTVAISPGANDNASGVAAMIYLAKYFKQLEDQVHLKFLFFTLEECDPVFEQIVYRNGLELGIHDPQYVVTQLRYVEDKKQFSKAMETCKTASLSYGEQFQNAYHMVKSDLSEPMNQYYRALLDRVRYFKDPLGFGQRALIGSTQWVDSNLSRHKNILGMIDLDSIGFTSNKPFSHTFDPNSGFDQFENFNVDFENRVGNFIVLVSNQRTEKINEVFKKNARRENLPFLHVDCPCSYKEAVQMMPEVLYADHAPFWKANIPCLFFTDTGGEMRYHFEHTQADTIDKLDFDMIERIVKTLKTTIQTLYEHLK